jgi:effector-binding domain-containing protein
MDFIQTYYPYEIITDTKEKLKTVLKFSLLSSYLGKEHYPKTILYTNSGMVNIFKKYIPFYDIINTEVLDNNQHNFKQNPEYYAIPKLYTYSNSNLPFIHVDLDTFIFDKPNKIQDESDDAHNGVFVGHFDFYFSKELHLNELKGYEEYYKPILDNVKSNNIWTSDILNEISLNRTINANIFGGYNHQLILHTYKKIVNNFEENQDFYKTQKYVSLFLEQMMFYPVSKIINSCNVINQLSQEGIYFNHKIESETIILHNHNRKIDNVIFKRNDNEGIKNYLIKNEFGGVFHYGNYKDTELYKDAIFEYIERHEILGQLYKKIENEL